jgi:hypothetical protein
LRFARRNTALDLLAAFFATRDAGRFRCRLNRRVDARLTARKLFAARRRVAFARRAAVFAKLDNAFPTALFFFCVRLGFAIP